MTQRWEIQFRSGRTIAFDVFDGTDMATVMGETAAVWFIVPGKFVVAKSEIESVILLQPPPAREA